MPLAQPRVYLIQRSCSLTAVPCFVQSWVQLHQEGPTQVVPGTAAGVESQVLGAAGWAGNCQVGEPHPFVGASWGVPPRLQLLGV